MSVIVCGVEVARAVVALGAGPRVVGADRDSRDSPGLGAAVDLGYGCDEAAGRARELAADVALLDGRDSALAARLEAQGVATRVLASAALNGVLEVNRELGVLFGAETRALLRNAEITRGSSAIAQRRDGSTRLRVAWVLPSSPTEGEPLGWDVVGGLGILHELLELAGAENAFHTPAVPRRRVGARAFAGADLVLNGARAPGPDVVVEVRSVPAELGQLPILDPLPRLEALHELLYPAADREAE